MKLISVLLINFMLITLSTGHRQPFLGKKLTTRPRKGKSLEKSTSSKAERLFESYQKWLLRVMQETEDEQQNVSVAKKDELKPVEEIKSIKELFWYSEYREQRNKKVFVYFENSMNEMKQKAKAFQETVDLALTISFLSLLIMLLYGGICISLLLYSKVLTNYSSPLKSRSSTEPCQTCGRSIEESQLSSHQIAVIAESIQNLHERVEALSARIIDKLGDEKRKCKSEGIKKHCKEDLEMPTQLSSHEIAVIAESIQNLRLKVEALSARMIELRKGNASLMELIKHCKEYLEMRTRYTDMMSHH